MLIKKYNIWDDDKILEHEKKLYQKEIEITKTWNIKVVEPKRKTVKKTTIALKPAPTPEPEPTPAPDPAPKKTYSLTVV